ncbi:hypothetical protein RHSIM_RhsimUnG0251900 [Rhododendron simsii]|uniref:Uncharacterized protein n=1 Tax=Rhododendron simsii TaxID=118357 RepID=A0A834L3L2_RHOSS|nr:hypothetical protein RHSIM_RhsimUnG0251900 [Rhododendron simsii]
MNFVCFSFFFPTSIQLSNTPGFEHDPLVPFLALNYYDRCISRHPIPANQESESGISTVTLQKEKDGEDREDDWYFGLFVIGCTTLAWKMRANGLSVKKLLGVRPIRVGSELIEVEVGHVDRMESLINSALNLPRRSITPFCFVNNLRSLTITPVCFMSYFMSSMHINDQQERKILKELVFENHLLDMHHDARFTQFRPSIIALVGIIAEREDGLGDFWDHVFGSEFVDLNDLDEIENCINLLQMIKEEKIVDAEAFVQPTLLVAPENNVNDNHASVQETIPSRIFIGSSDDEAINAKRKWAEILRSWPDDEAIMAGELHRRVQKLKRSSRRI